jgi:hypothetical protein
VDHTPGTCARRGGDGLAFVLQNYGGQSLGAGGRPATLHQKRFGLEFPHQRHGDMGTRPCLSCGNTHAKT